jgi:hypothetical protein
MYNRDTDIVLYIHTHTCIPMHARRCRAIDTRTHIHPSIRMHEGMAAAKRRWSRRCACACAHLGIRTRLDARASIQTHRCTDGHTTPPRARTRTRSRRHGFYICTHTYTYVLTQSHIYVSLVVARVRAAPDTRSHAHTHTHIRADMYSIYALLHIHMGSDMPTYMYRGTHI